MTRKRIARLCFGLVLCGLGLLLARPDPARAESLVADLSEYLISISSNFSGARIHAFGVVSRDAPQGEDSLLVERPEDPDIVLVLTGPPRTVTVRQKDQVAGIWVNRDSIRFTDVPAYAYVASNRPLDEIANGRVLVRNNIGLENIRMTTEEARRIRVPQTPTAGEIRGPASTRIATFKEALIRQKRAQGLYEENAAGVSIRAGRLFRAQIDLPAQVPVGNYTAKVYLLRNGAVVGAQTIPLYVEKGGLEHSIYEFSRDWPFAYGVAAVAIAALAGFGASSLFRRT